MENLRGRGMRRNDLLRLDRADQWRAHRFGHSEKDHIGVRGKAGGLRLVRVFTESRIRIVPAVSDPGVAGGIDDDGRDDFQTADVAALRRDRIARCQSRRTGLRAHAAELGDGVASRASDPDVVIAVDGNPPRSGDTSPRIEGAVNRAVGTDHRHIAAGKLIDDVPQVRWSTIVHL